MFLTFARRSSRQQLKQNHSRHMALQQHVDWIKQVDASDIAMKDILKVDPAVRSMKERVSSKLRPTKILSAPDMLDKQPSLANFDQLDALIRPKYSGLIAEVPIGSYGSVSFVHGNIFDTVGDALILPIPPNLQPHRGLALETLERGGDTFVKDLFSKVRIDFADEIASSPHGLPVGSVVKVDMAGKQCYMVVLPFYWQGTTTEAARRFRFAVRSALNRVVEDGCTTVALPHLGRGIFGFEAPWTAVTLAEEVIECGLMQIDTVNPPASIERIIFCDTNTEVLKRILDAASSRMEEPRVTAKEFFANKARRLLVLHEFAETSKARKADKVKFKQFSGIIRNLRLNYQRFIRPNIWRAAKTNPVPPLLVDKKTGLVAGTQLPGRPFYRREISHTLFPVPARSGFTGLRRTQSGKWAAKITSPKSQLQAAVNPRL